MKRIHSTNFLFVTAVYLSYLSMAGAPIHDKGGLKPGRLATKISAAVILVPQDYSTIQAAVDAANDDDVIILSPGSYSLTESVIVNKRITLASEFINSDNEEDIDETVITSTENLDPLIQFNQGATGSKCIGITFREALKQLTLECDYMEVTHCKFFDNLSDALSIEGGGGLFAYNYFENNGDEAIDADDSLDWIAEHNTIINPGDDGFEIRLHNNDGSARLHIIRYNFISGADEDGIQLIDYDGDSGREFQIHHNIIRNSAMVGLGCTRNGNTVEDFEGSYMVENTFVFNNVFDNNDHGITGANNMLVFNNIISSSQTVAIKKLDNNSSADYNCLFNNETDFLNAITGPNNIFADPLYESLYSLNEASPCIDAGIRTYSNNGLSQTVAEEDILGAFPDMGAKEFGNGMPPSNLAPLVSAGLDQVLINPDNQISLMGVVSDDGLPDGNRLTVNWSQEKGPSQANATFADNTNPSTTVTFDKQGAYELRLSADDGEEMSSDKVTVFYVKDFNDATIELSESIYIEAEEYRYLVGDANVEINNGASENEIIRALPGDEIHAYTQYRLITFTSGTYYVWINASGPGTDANGLSVAFNDLEVEFSVEGFPTNSFGDESWVRTTFEDIPEGVYPLRVSAREGAVAWDRIFITMDENEIPFSTEDNEEVMVYPVPNPGEFTVALKSPETTKIEIFDLQGRLVYATSVDDTLFIPLDIGVIGRGVYILNITSNAKSIKKKIVIN